VDSCSFRFSEFGALQGAEGGKALAAFDGLERITMRSLYAQAHRSKNE
jgi:hypothetical protein